MLKFDKKTTLGLLAEFKGLRVRMTHVTRRTRTTRTKMSFSNQKIVQTLNFFWTPNFLLGDFH